MDNFWRQLDKPLLIQAPMADLTCPVYRQLIAKYGKPDIMFTEFVACDGLCSVGRENLLPIFRYAENQQPIVAQLFGSRPDNFYTCAQLAVKLGFAGIDINMGCPDKTILKQGAGSDLITNPELALKIINKTKEGAGSIPVSVKTRLGYNQDSVKDWIAILLKAEPVAITIHGRTKKQMYAGEADWQAIKLAVELRNKLGSKTLIIGNGDITSLEIAQQRIDENGVDGVMVGRSLLGNPWFFNKEIQKQNLSLREVCQVLLEHARLYESMNGVDNKFFTLRKHFGFYLKGFTDVKPLRMALMVASNADEVEIIIKSQLNKL